MAEQNDKQVADWNDQSGERCVAHQARLDAMLAVFGQAAIEAAAPATGERVLDVGRGAGTSSLALAARVGAEGQVLGVDISEPLIDRARALAPQDTPVLFRVADASSTELPEGAFDTLFSRFGDRGRVARILTAAGFTDIAIAPFDASVPFGEGTTRDAAIDDAVRMALEVGPLSRALADQPYDIRARASAAVRAAFADGPGERSVIIDGAAWIVTARNPAS